MSWDELDRNIYNTMKESIRMACKAISEGEYKPYSLPVVLLDFHNWESLYFKDEFEAEKYVQENYANDWDEPPKGEDEELVVIKYCSEEEIENLPHTHRKFKFIKEINGVKIYREKTFVSFEPELVINVSI